LMHAWMHGLAAQSGIQAFLTAPIGISSILNDNPELVNMSSVVSRISGLVSFLKRSPQKAAAFQEIVKGVLGKKLAMLDDSEEAQFVEA
ncbi:uncharacterized protein VP01_2873g2, partial [Puccinia sorghi]